MTKDEIINGLEREIKSIRREPRVKMLGICMTVDEAEDIIALLKEQEAVKPHYNPRSNWYECGACHYSMTSGMHCRSELIPAYKVGFCAKCGKAVKWDG